MSRFAKRFLGIMIGAIATLPAWSQQYLADVNGRVITAKTYQDIEGTPYFPEDWVLGKVTIQQGGNKVAGNITLRYNLHSGEPEYKKDDNTYAFAVTVVEFSFENNTKVTNTFRCGFPNIDTQTPKSFYEILSDDKIKLLRFVKANIFEERTYGSPPKKRFVTAEYFYFFKPDGQMLKAKKDKKTLLDLLSDKRAEVEKFMDGNKLKIREWTEVTQVLEYYNGL